MRSNSSYDSTILSHRVCPNEGARQYSAAILASTWYLDKVPPCADRSKKPSPLKTYCSFHPARSCSSNNNNSPDVSCRASILARWRYSNANRAFVSGVSPDALSRINCTNRMASTHKSTLMAASVCEDKYPSVNTRYKTRCTTGRRATISEAVSVSSTTGEFSRCCRARLKRLYAFSSVINNRSAISRILNPHKLLSVNTNCDSIGIVSLHVTNNIRNNESLISPGSGTSDGSGDSASAITEYSANSAFRRFVTRNSDKSWR